MRIDDHVVHAGKGKRRTTRCRYCHDLINTPSKDRWQSHIRNCEQAPTEVRSYFGIHHVVVPVIDITAENTTSEPNQSMSNGQRGKRLRSNSGWFDRVSPAEKSALDAAYADVYYHTGIPFNVADNSAVTAFFKILRPAWTPPNRRQLSGTLLEASFARQVGHTAAAFTREPLVALVTDGWSNIRNDHLVNYVAVFPYSDNPPIFLKSIVTGETKQTSESIADAIEAVIDEVGRHRVAGVVTDNAANMQGAWSLLKQRHPTLICNGCAAHTFNLLVKDVCQSPDIASVLESCRTITTFVKTRTAVVSRFKTIQTAQQLEGTIQHKRRLVLPADTRWYTHHSCVKRVLENKDVLRQLASHPVVDGITGQSRIKRDEFIGLVLDQSFWDRVGSVETILCPTSKIIGELEANGTALSRVYQSFLDLREKWAANKQLVALVDDRWAFLHTESMGMAYFLDPKTAAGEKMVGTDRLDTIMQIQKYAKRLCPSAKDADIAKSIGDFTEHMTHLTDTEISFVEQHSPRLFWNVAKCKYPLLAKVADIVFAIPTSQAASERVWSLYDFIHSKRRNKLTTETAGKLVYLYANARSNQRNIVDLIAGVASEDDEN
jgi:hypothetical protein